MQKTGRARSNPNFSRIVWLLSNVLQFISIELIYKIYFKFAYDCLGIELNCAVAVCGKPAGPALIRHLILCWSGDHIGLCEVGKFIRMGKSGCRRCDLEIEYMPVYKSVNNKIHYSTLQVLLR